MAGLYIHIPFCAKRCIYCDFFSNTEMRYKEPFLAALVKELETRRAYLQEERLDTIYFGGGTPSQLSIDELERIFKAVYRLFTVREDAEITLEANPDDMTAEYAHGLRSLPVNRISMGVQSFSDADLRFLQRRHTGEQARKAVATCKENGFSNISIDLIYGLPGQTLDGWEKNLDEAIRLDIPHLSAYHIIYEEGTRLNRLKEEGKVTPVDEDLSLALFNRLIDKLAEAGYQHYEISNFARHGQLAEHNSSYWTGRKYLGVGPSAHSYDGDSRQWNVSSLPAYIEGIMENCPQIEAERLNISKKYNDYVITGLRTMWGISRSALLTKFGEGIHNYCLTQAAPFIKQGLLRLEGDKLILSRRGLFLSDMIMSELLKV